MRRAGYAAAGLMAGLAVVLTGCLSPLVDKAEAVVRPQAADDAVETDALATVGQKTAVGNMDPIPVSGVGLVYELHGTGSVPAHDGWRTVLETAIRKQKGDPKRLLDDPGRSTSLVLVRAMIPPGARQGDKLDVAISLPQGSKTTSLKGGVLLACDLNNSELAGQARQALAAAGVPTGRVPQSDPNAVLLGHRLAAAEGPVLSGTDGDGEGGRPSGRIWGGAQCLMDRPYYFLLNDNTPQPRLAMVIAERLNSVFHAPGDKLNKVAEAKVHNRPLVVAFVPPAYRLNHGRFLLVARQVPLTPILPDSPYRKQLEVELTRPETTLVAAIKLEALGEGAEHALRVGLEGESAWVRFAAAQSLAYLGKGDERVAAELARLAETHPALRSHCLTALASQDDAYCVDQLAELMKKADPGLRYGAFVALRTADEKHEAVRGVKLSDQFWLHQVAPASEPMVHVRTDRRNEVVLFGSQWPLAGPFSFAVGKEFTVTAGANEPATVTKVVLKDGEPTPVAVKCRADLGAVLKAVGELGGSYADAIEVVRQADKADALVAAVQFDAAPRGLTVQHLAQIARSDPSLDRADLEVERVGQQDVVQTSHDVPTEGDAVLAKPAPTDPELNKDPGRLLFPKTDDDPNQPALNRSPGNLLGGSKK